MRTDQQWQKPGGGRSFRYNVVLSQCYIMNTELGAAYFLLVCRSVVGLGWNPRCGNSLHLRTCWFCIPARCFQPGKRRLLRHIDSVLCICYTLRTHWRLRRGGLSSALRFIQISVSSSRKFNFFFVNFVSNLILFYFLFRMV